MRVGRLKKARNRLLQLPRTVARVLQLPRHEPCGVQLLGSEANLFQVLRGEVRQLQLRGVEAHLLEGCGAQAGDFRQVVGADPGHAEMLPVERQLQQHLDERGAVRRLHHRRADRVLRPAVPQLPEPGGSLGCGQMGSTLMGPLHKL